MKKLDSSIIENNKVDMFSEFIKNHYKFFVEIIITFFSICLLIIIILFYSKEICYLNLLFIKLTILILLLCIIYNNYLKLKDYKKMSKDNKYINHRFFYIYGTLFACCIVFSGLIFNYVIM